MKELDTALKAAREAGSLILKYYGKGKFKVRHKGQIDLVTEVDEKAQAKIVKLIKKAFPSDLVLAEEGDLSKTSAGTRRWIVDPIDGTTNFAHGYPRFCVSIAFEKNAKIECGVIYDPVLREAFYARRGKGAFLNGKRIRISGETELKQALLVTGFAYDLKKPETDNLPLFSKLLFKAQAIRRDGSAALNLAYVACGRFDGFWELGLKAWDMAAGVLLVEEAGGLVKALSKRRHQNLAIDLAVGHPKLVNSLHRQIKGLVLP